MQEKAQKTEIRSLDSFDNEISIWNLVGGKSLKFLQKIADVYNELHKEMKPLSILVFGETSKTLYSRCFLRAIAVKETTEIPANILNFRNEFEDFFNSSDPEQGYIVDNVQVLTPDIQHKLLQILRNGEYKTYSHFKNCIELHPIWGPVILTSKTDNVITSEIMKSVNYIINIKNTKEDIKKIIRMRLDHAHIGYDNRVIETLAKGKSLRSIIYIAKMAIVLMIGEGRNHLTMDDLEKVGEYF